MNEDKIDVNQVLAGLVEANELDEYGNAGRIIEACIRQQQEKITKYELRHAVQRDRIAILEAQLKKAQKNG